VKLKSTFFFLFGIYFSLFNIGATYAQLAGYDYVKQIDIDNTQVSGTSDLIDFPLLINTTDSDLRSRGNGGYVENANGYDIAFTASDGVTLLDHEIEKYTATTGELVVWVRIPTLDYNDDTQIFMYYGNSSVSVDPSTTDTWNANYEAVWHLDEETAGTGTSNLYEDATANNNDGDDLVSATGTDGQIGLGQEFDGNNDYIDVSVMDPHTYDELTFSAWYKSANNGVADDEYIFAHYDASSWFLIGPTDDGSYDDYIRYYIEVNGGPSRYYYGSIDVVDQQWHHIAAVRTATNIIVYVDGVVDLNTADLDAGESYTVNSTGTSPTIGYDPVYANPVDGFLDEIRLTNSAMSQGWIVTEYNNQSDPSSFYTISAHAIALSPGGVTDQLVLWLKADNGVEEAVGNSAEEGDAVNNWVDKSAARTNDAVKSNPPTFRNNATNNVNFNPVVEFDGTNDGLNFGNDYIYSSGTGSEDGMTFFAVVQPDLTTSKPEQYIFQFGTFTNGYAGGISDDAMRLYSPSKKTYLNSGSTPNPYGPNNSNPVLIRYTWDFDDQHQTIHVNGEITPSKDEANTTTKLTAAEIDQNSSHQAGSGPFAIGRQTYTTNINNNNGRYLQGSIAEIIGYKKDLTSSEYVKIESYLAIKYGISIDNTGGGAGGDYVASDGSTIWDADIAGGYHNEILAIGRDDMSGLYQKQTQDQTDSLTIYIDALAADNDANTGSITNDLSFLVVGHNGGKQRAQPVEMPAGIKSRFEREWQVTNYNFDDAFSMEIEWDNVNAGGFDIAQIRLLVDDDEDFSNATILGPSDGLTFAEGSIIVGGISTTHIPKNSTRFITIASISTAVPLPIELVSFTATVNNEKSVELNWETVSEINNDFFTIERSKDAETWREIMTVDGAGNSSEKLSYKAEDSRPYSGMSYYRLKQTDFDGKFSYSEVEVVSLEGAPQSELLLYPNPAQENITLEGIGVGVLPIFIYNVYGQLVSDQILVTDKQADKLIIDIASLKVGIYTVKSQDSYIKFIKK
jgi:DNA uptake protein ComE-like DNA-binding protein